MNYETQQVRFAKFNLLPVERFVATQQQLALECNRGREEAEIDGGGMHVPGV